MADVADVADVAAQVAIFNKMNEAVQALEAELTAVKSKAAKAEQVCGRALTAAAKAVTATAHTRTRTYSRMHTRACTHVHTCPMTACARHSAHACCRRERASSPHCAAAAHSGAHRARRTRREAWPAALVWQIYARTREDLALAQAELLRHGRSAGGGPAGSHAPPPGQW